PMLDLDNAPASRVLFASLERRLPKQTFETWFRPLIVRSSSSDRVLTVAAPNAVVMDWILAHYADIILDCLGESALNEYKVEWTFPSPSNEPSRPARSREQSSTPDVSIGRDDSEEAEAIRFVDTAPSPLNEKYTFENFVVASCNRFAHAATKAVADLPGQTYNPLYLYGGVGLGKTHLIQATGHAIKAARPNLQIAYLSLERFMIELINAIRYGYAKTRT